MSLSDATPLPSLRYMYGGKAKRNPCFFLKRSNTRIVISSPAELLASPIYQESCCQHSGRCFDGKTLDDCPVRHFFSVIISRDLQSPIPFLPYGSG
ncbi:hypothetical protein AVEN_47780-1 [Araneus ventricosus]|uniref:Uncharacterized protein n=1 Tax=Araneus ventricosus TaxID=182803 RepID=A0A4Y2S168_ARAVE|nr:hypothetical protein AVEN_47780-1 [Araneus ventricosus]